jgi:hypothetical protein
MTGMMARIDADGWELESAIERHERFPDTFWIPSKADREGLVPGQAVKLIFRLRDAGAGGEDEIATERMWVYVTGRSGDLFEGRLQNVPGTECGLAPGTPVRFLAEHVADIDHPPEDYDPW